MVLLCCSVAISDEVLRHLLLDGEKGGMLHFLRKGRYLSSSQVLDEVPAYALISIYQQFQFRGLMRRRMVFSLVSTLTGISSLCARYRQGLSALSCSEPLYLSLLARQSRHAGYHLPLDNDVGISALHSCQHIGFPGSKLHHPVAYHRQCLSDFLWSNSTPCISAR